MYQIQSELYNFALRCLHWRRPILFSKMLSQADEQTECVTVHDGLMNLCMSALSCMHLSRLLLLPCASRPSSGFAVDLAE